LRTLLKVTEESGGNSFTQNQACYQQFKIRTNGCNKMKTDQKAAIKYKQTKELQ